MVDQIFNFIDSHLVYGLGYLVLGIALMILVGGICGKITYLIRRNERNRDRLQEAMEHLGRVDKRLDNLEKTKGKNNGK